MLCYALGGLILRIDDCLDIELRSAALHPKREFFDRCGDDFLRAALFLIPLGNSVANLIARLPLEVLDLGKHDHRGDRPTLHSRERQPCHAFTRPIDMKEQVSIGCGGMQIHGINADRLLEGFKGKRYVGHGDLNLTQIKGALGNRRSVVITPLREVGFLLLDEEPTYQD